MGELDAVLDASPDVVVVVDEGLADITDGVDINDCAEEVEDDGHVELLLTLDTYGGMVESLTLSGKRRT